MTKKDDLSKYILADYDFATFAAGTRVVDIGCGKGRQVQKLMARGCVAVGVEPNEERARHCTELGVPVVFGLAEHLPFPSASFDGVICKAVIPLTHEPAAVREIARILKPGATAEFCCQGAGFYVRLLVTGAGGWLKQRVYGLRTLLNTWLFACTGRTLPANWGDTLYQSRRRLRKYYEQNHFTIVRDMPARTYLGLPVFIYHRLQFAPAEVRPEVEPIRTVEATLPDEVLTNRKAS